MKRILLLLPALSLFFTLTARATDYYYCDCQAGASAQCVSGDDANNGTTPDTARKSFTNAHSTFTSAAAGDGIKFCRGGSFISSADTMWTSPDCNAAGVCSVADYDLPGQESPRLPRPIITQTDNSSLFSLFGGNSGHKEGYSFSNLDLRCTGCLTTGAAYGFHVANDTDHITISNVSIDSFRIGIHLATSATGDGALDFITLSKLSITNNLSQGLLGGANHLTIEDSYFENNGGGTNRDHNIYISRGSNLIIRNNELYRSSLNEAGVCMGAPLVVHAKEPPLDTALIEGNIVHEDIGKANAGCWGIAVDPGNTSPEVFLNYTIRANKVINTGNTGIGLTSCQNCVVENNVIVHEQPGYKIRAIDAPSKTRSSNDQPMDAITIRNNSIYINNDVSGSIGIKLKGEGNQHRIVSNSIHYAGTGTFYCLDADLPAVDYEAINNNVCYFPNASGASKWNLYLTTSSDPLGDWKLTGFGTHSKMEDPGYTRPGTPYVELAPANDTSALIGAGHLTLSASTDHRGNIRDMQPDAGAYEFGTFNPPAKTTLYLVQ